MNDQNINKDVDSDSSHDHIRKRRRTWVVVGVIILLLIVGYELMTNWENFSRGLSGKPETTN